MPQLQRKTWIPLSNPGLSFMLEWDITEEPPVIHCIEATQDGFALGNPTVFYEYALRESLMEIIPLEAPMEDGPSNKKGWGSRIVALAIQPFTVIKSLFK